MNELLKNLRVQAINYCMDKGSQGNLSEEVSEKFAELIVQECVNVLHDNELWSRDVSHVLKEHFGVEE